MANKPDPIPETMSIAEAGDFWDTHSVADYPTRVVEMEFEPLGRTTLVALEDGLLQRLKTRARETGVSVGDPGEPLASGEVDGLLSQ